MGEMRRLYFEDNGTNRYLLAPPNIAIGTGLRWKILEVHRWEKTLFYSENGVSSGTFSESLSSFDMIGIRIVSGVNPEYARSRSGASWAWVDGSNLQGDSGHTTVYWSSTDSTLSNFFNFQFTFNFNNQSLTFNTSVNNTSISNRIYTPVDSNGTLLANNTDLSSYLLCVSKIVGVRFQ